jgi:STE24 endopeptidase
MNTSFECDSNTYFNFAKGNSISLLRGPGYPIFLFLTGMNSSEGSLYFVLFLQWFMGILIVLLVISFLKTNNHLLRFIFSLLIANPLLSRALGVEIPNFHIGLVAFGILYSPVSFVLDIFMNEKSC